MSLKKGLQKPGRTPAFTFELYVPRMAGRTDLLSLFLEIVGGTARTLVEVALEHWNPKDKPPNYYIFVERRFAPCYAVHFPYNARPFWQRGEGPSAQKSFTPKAMTSNKFMHPIPK